ncbi:MAG: hypothetical protein AAF711_16800, partial [Planctomycetota bacterium]
ASLVLMKLGTDHRGPFDHQRLNRHASAHPCPADGTLKTNDDIDDFVADARSAGQGWAEA